MIVSKFRYAGTILLVLLSIVGVNKGSPAGQNGQGAVFSASKFDLSERWRWTTEPWTSSDKSYIAIRTQIDKALSVGQNPDTLLNTYRRKALGKPKSPQAQFALGYAAYKAAKAETRDLEKSVKKVQGVRKAIEQVPSPHSYQYARVHFLVSAVSLPEIQLLTAGKRLLKRNPMDYEVKFHVVSILANAYPMRKTEALKYAHELVHSNPKRANGYTVLGSVYAISWLNSQSDTDAIEAINAYKRYLQLAPADAGFRKIAERTIKRLQDSRRRKTGR